MLNIKRKFVTLFVAIFSMILCFGSLTACASNETQNNNPPEPIYTQAKLQLEYEECVMGAGDVAEISASAHARIGNGNYVTSVTGFTYKSDNNAALMRTIWVWVITATLRDIKVCRRKTLL